MLIGDKYKVEADRMNIILSIKKVAKDDEDALDDGEDEKEQGWRIMGYFYNFRELLKFMVDNDIKGEGLDDLNVVAEKQETLYALILTVKNITPDGIPCKSKEDSNQRCLGS